MCPSFKPTFKLTTLANQVRFEKPVNASDDDALGLVVRGLPPVECVPEETNRPRLDGFLKDAEIIIDELPPIVVGDGFTVELKNLLGRIVTACRRRYER